MVYKYLESELSILVISHSSYSDLWPIFFSELEENFGKPCQLYLSVDILPQNTNINGVTIISEEYPESSTWSKRVLNACEVINTKYVLLLIDDIFFKEKIDLSELEEYLGSMVILGLKSLKLFYEPNFKPELLIPGTEKLGVFNFGAMNRINTHATIWEVSFLQDILDPEESIWEFEVNGTFRSNTTFFIGGVTSAFLNYELGVVKGRWERRTISRLHKKGYSQFLTKRGKLSMVDTLKRFLVLKVLNFFIYKLSINLRKRIKRMLDKKVGK